MTKRAIPLVDLSTFVHGSAAQQAAFVEAIGDAFRTSGFVGVVNHGVPTDLVDRFYAQSKAFFALPVDVKRNYEVPGLAGQRGYTSFGKEHAKHSTVADLKEFYQIGQTVVDGDAVEGEYPPNVQVAEQPEFAPTGDELYRAFEHSGGHLLEAIALSLGLDGDYFTEKIHNGNSSLLDIH